MQADSFLVPTLLLNMHTRTPSPATLPTPTMELWHATPTATRHETIEFHNTLLNTMTTSDTVYKEFYMIRTGKLET